ncbi:MAG: dTDP-4-dehydrorhamnose reductase [Bacteroidales bacterium]|nr:dTDP-4-dehydrorhamnose reductase [Bacteroidales bacterium]
MKKNILITGSKGQLGSELQDVYPDFPEFNFFPTDIDTLDLTHKKNLEDYVTQNNIHYIINCAAYTAVDKAEEEQELCYQVNHDAVKNIAESAKGIAKVIHISTDYVFDGTNNQPYQETDPTNPQSVYGKSKRQGEEILLSIHPGSMVIRTSWLYSSYGNNFAKTILRLANEKNEINVVADQHGTPTYAADLAGALLSVIRFIEKEGIFPSGVYHYSNEGATTWYGFAQKILELSDITNCKVHPITTDQYPTKAKRPMYSILDKSKIKRTFNITIPEWENGLRLCLNQIFKNK